jgi:hypothetical protein
MVGEVVIVLQTLFVFVYCLWRRHGSQHVNTNVRPKVYGM